MCLQVERGDRIELLVDEAATMKDGASHFKKQSKRLHQALWMKNSKLLQVRIYLQDYLCKYAPGSPVEPSFESGSANTTRIGLHAQLKICALDCLAPAREEGEVLTNCLHALELHSQAPIGLPRTVYGHLYGSYQFLIAFAYSFGLPSEIALRAGRYLTNDSSCLLRGHYSESILHVLRDCTTVRRLWTEVVLPGIKDNFFLLPFGNFGRGGMISYFRILVSLVDVRRISTAWASHFSTEFAANSLSVGPCYISYLRNHAWCTDFVWTPRSCNNAADAMSRLLPSHLPQLSVFHKAPPSIEHLITGDSSELPRSDNCEHQVPGD
ncbi:hypothetical protein V6N12_064612 [Hibiscus sabdariffa]|uniref:V-SNARE coiled-coil homology domain-containing protein n=1 Tax=Hibiscus sabdariffa TaxID=183260 RepID=A0ABR2G6J6_9ROSI